MCLDVGCDRNGSVKENYKKGMSKLISLLLRYLLLPMLKYFVLSYSEILKNSIVILRGCTTIWFISVYDLPVLAVVFNGDLSWN